MIEMMSETHRRWHIVTTNIKLTCSRCEAVDLHRWYLTSSSSYKEKNWSSKEYAKLTIRVSVLRLGIKGVAKKRKLCEMARVVAGKTISNIYEIIHCIDPQVFRKYIELSLLAHYIRSWNMLQLQGYDQITSCRVIIMQPNSRHKRNFDEVDLY